MNKKIKFGNRLIGTGEPLYFIADIGANHDGNINKAFKLIELAKEAGADAAKRRSCKHPRYSYPPGPRICRHYGRNDGQGRREFFYQYR